MELTKAERNKQIYRERCKGEKVVNLKRKYGLSRTWIYNILRKEERKEDASQGIWARVRRLFLRDH